METKTKVSRPAFPEKFAGIQPVFPAYDGKQVTLGSLECLACIPLYTLEKDKKKQEKMKQEYEKQKANEYAEIKAIYDANCFVGTVFSGGGSTSARITKIVISEFKAYVCYKASHAHVKEVEEENKTRDMQMKPIKPGVFGLNAFLSAIAIGRIIIISKPNQ